MNFETVNGYQSNKVKRLPPSVIKDIELKNHARRLATGPELDRRCGWAAGLVFVDI